MILTPRLRLIPCDDTLYDAIRMGNNILARVLGANVPKKWTDFRDTFGPMYIHWKAHPELQDWWTHLIVYRPDNILIGVCGYKGEPDAQGVVEIGYEIRASHRSKGLATEAARGLVEHAFSYTEVQKVIAHTISEENYSSMLLQKLGFTKIPESIETDSQQFTRWEVNRLTYKSA